MLKINEKSSRGKKNYDRIFPFVSVISFNKIRLGIKTGFYSIIMPFLDSFTNTNIAQIWHGKQNRPKKLIYLFLFMS